MSVVWPPQVPQQWSLSGRFDRPTNGFMTTSFDKGAPVRRRDTLSAPWLVSISLVAITDDELQYFNDWYDLTLGGGALRFTMPHPRTGEIRLWAFSDPTVPPAISYISGDRADVQLNLHMYPYAPS